MRRKAETGRGGRHRALAHSLRKRPAAERSARPPVLPLRRKPRNIPFFWRVVRRPQGSDSQPRDLRTCGLILEAKGIPWLHSGQGGLYAPPLYTRRAEAELAAYSMENRPLPVPDPPPVYHNAVIMLVFFLLLLCWHGMMMHWWPGTAALPGEAAWKAAGSLDVFSTAYMGEWWRCLTALTLHSDSEHLFGNVFGGCIFLPLLGRMIGAGPSLLLILLGGTLGNAINVLYRPFSHNSLGFSTALFACVGLTVAIYAVRHTGRGRILLPLAAGVGILASLGTGDIQGRTDYAAHIFGLLSGMILGAAYGKVLLRFPRPGLLFRQACLAAGLVLPALAWSAAMR